MPAHTLVPLPAELSFATGAAISCGTGTAFQALRRMNLSEGEHDRHRQAKALSVSRQRS